MVRLNPCLVIIALLLVSHSASIICQNDDDDDSKERKLYCLPEVFEFFINNCPTSRRKRFIIDSKFSISTHKQHDVLMRTLRDANHDCCNPPGCTRDEILAYC
ncbi:hypothetical protein TrispH2_007881 [Trichoplax sp. H2]|nr:hypothetical protein TrispH2_007881 [Trichoplax sp. H2]|eukprot:RDD40837.1 hypothetical protein TrispH2_007881 [Trichoplax sp. H2]